MLGKLILTVSGEWVDFLAKRTVSAKGSAGTKERDKLIQTHSRTEAGCRFLAVTTEQVLKWPPGRNSRS